MQSNAIEKTWDAITCNLNYTVTHPEAITRCLAIEIICIAHSDAFQLLAPKGRSRAVAYFSLSNKLKPEEIYDDMTLNGLIIVLWNILKNIMGTSAETEIRACYLT